jgi:hypothetical protein
MRLGQIINCHVATGGNTFHHLEAQKGNCLPGQKERVVKENDITWWMHMLCAMFEVFALCNAYLAFQVLADQNSAVLKLSIVINFYR